MESPSGNRLINVGAVAVIPLSLVSMITLFVMYADWWNRIVDAPYAAETWLVTFSRWPWIRLPILWGTCTVLTGIAARDADEGNIFTAGGLMFLLVYLLTYPGLESLHLHSDGASVGFLIVIHGIAAVIVAKQCSKKRER